MKSSRALRAVLTGFMLLGAPAAIADITGLVVDEFDGQPIADARVRVQATVTPPALSAADGSFSLPDPASSVVVTAALPYDSTRPLNYIIGSQTAAPGDDIVIRLRRLPASDQSPYQPATSVDCASCHSQQFQQWQDSRHAGAGTNPWVLDLFSGNGTPGGAAGYVFRDTHDPGETGFCATCHAPLADAQDPGNVMLDEVTLPAGLDGVNCLACHQMAEVNDDVDALHHLGNTLYRFPEDPSPSLWVWGPLDDISFDTMRSSFQPGFSESRFCASCHQYDNPDTGAPGQSTFEEWLASPYSAPGPGFRACQDCHMPEAAGPGPISSLSGQPIRPASQRHSHEFIGSTPATLAQAMDLDLVAALDGTSVLVSADVSNVGAGHAFPTGVSIRNAILHVEATASGQPLPLVDGPTIPYYGSADGGTGPDDLAGRAGRGYARVLAGRINGTGPVVSPVLFIDAESVESDTRIPAGASDISAYRFDLSGVAGPAVVEVRARLLYRRAWRELAVTKGWTQTPSGDPVQTVVASADATLTWFGSGMPVAVPALGTWALGLLISLVLAAAWASSPRGRRRRGSPR